MGGRTISLCPLCGDEGVHGDMEICAECSRVALRARKDANDALRALKKNDFKKAKEHFERGAWRVNVTEGFLGLASNCRGFAEEELSEEER